jgi:hypothetical protein
MTIPTKTVVNVQTGEVTVVELSGEELAAYEASLAAQAAESAAQEQAPVEGQ